MSSLALALILLSTLAVVLRKYARRSSVRKESIAIVVLGDIARSPRMLRHALSFAEQQWYVSVFAYRGSKPPDTLLHNPNVQLVNLPEFPDWISPHLPRIIFVLVIGPLKALYLSASLISTLLFRANHCSYIMVQNPPAIPTLPIIQLARTILGSKLIIDWHNTAYSILALKVGSDKHPMVRLARWIEATFGKHATLHLFVTEAEKQALSELWSLRGLKKVFYDRPPKSFCRLNVREIHTFFSRSPFNYDPTLQEMFIGSTPALDKETLLSHEDQGTKSVQMKADRPALLVSSTSWTIDEDFNVLIDALSIYARAKTSSHRSLPKLMCLITGKGPLKAQYLSVISKRSRDEGWQKIGVVCQSVWFDEPEDYRQLLGAADLGISLHQSSSGLDLPMKIVDMFGCGLPVCARNFSCISELVKHRQNGLVFESAAELSEQLKELLTGFPADHRSSSSTSHRSVLRDLRQGIHTTVYGSSRPASDDTTGRPLATNDPRAWSCWEDAWDLHVFRAVQSL